MLEANLNLWSIFLDHSACGAYGATLSRVELVTGGASALTPAEIREARSQADAEFEKEKKHAKKRREGKGDKEKGGTGEEDALFGGTLSGKLPSSVEILRYKVRQNVFSFHLFSPEPT